MPTTSGAGSNPVLGTLLELIFFFQLKKKNGYLGGHKQFFEYTKIRTPQKKGSDQKGDGRYYPFGLTMAGISDKAVKQDYAENKYRFNNGSELQNKEFSDGSGLEMYDAIHRMYDPQLGRFGQIDPLPEFNVDLSPYSFANGDPISHVDPLGDTAWKDLPTATVTAKKPLDTRNGQVLPSESWFEDFWEGHRAWRAYPGSPWAYAVDRKGYILPGVPVTNNLTIDIPVGEEPLDVKSLINLKNFIKSRYLIYRATKIIKEDENALLYIGKAKEALKSRYTLAEIDEMGVTAIKGLENIPNNAIALGVEQLTIDLNGGAGTGALANKIPATVKEAYINVARDWLNKNMPNWQQALKFQ